MLSEDVQLVKKARMLRHAQRNVSNDLKARFSPTAIWTTTSESDAPAPTTAATTPNPVAPPVTRTTPIPVTTVPATSVPVVPTQPSVTLVTTPVLSASTSTSIASPSTTPTIASTTSTSPTTAVLIPTTSLSSISTPSSQTTAFVTRTVSTSSRVAASSTASSTATTAPSSGMSAAGIIGIAGAGIVGAAVLAGLAMFFIRRWNRKENEYDPNEFRRQSVVLRDDNSSLHRGDSNGRGPRPPTMFERHNQNITAAFAMPPSNVYRPQIHPYGAPAPFNDVPASQASQPVTSGMYISASAGSPAPTGQYANVSPFFNPTSQSPAASPVTVASYGGVAFDAQGGLVRAPSNHTVSMLSRNHSLAHARNPVEESDYADLSRASVTPFQAAQYEAISKQLNIPPPKPLHQVSEAEEVEESRRVSVESLPLPFPETSAKHLTGTSPFDDPQAGSAQIADEDDMKLKPSRQSSEFHSTAPFALAAESTQRITSQPPSLPEIRMMSGSFSPAAYSFPVTPSPRNGSFDAYSGRASPKVDLPPLSPVSTSPQRARFVDGLEARAHDGHETPVEIGFVADDKSAPKMDPEPTQAKAQAPKRPATVYNDEDAYGGF